MGLARQGWEYGAQDREPFTKLGWVQPSRQPSRVAGESCGWSPEGEKKGAGSGKWKIQRLRTLQGHLPSLLRAP